MGDASGNERQIEHRFGIRLIDRIPLLRELPSFRTRTLCKELLAGLCYLSTIRFIILLRDSETLIALMIVIPTYILVPLMIGFNMGNCLRFFPKHMRMDTYRFLMIRILIILTALFCPIAASALFSNIE